MPGLLRKSARPAVALPDITLTGPRLIVRPPRATDAEIWCAARNRNRDYLTPYEPQWPDGDLTPARFADRLQRQTADWRLGRMQSFLIFLTNGTLAGGIAINNIARGAAQYATLGYWLDETLQGRGLMAEALRLIIDYAFDEVKLHRLNAGCLTHNTRSHTLLLKAGFRVEGLAEKYLEIAGTWQDHVLFGLPVERYRLSAQKAEEGRAAISGPSSP